MAKALELAGDELGLVRDQSLDDLKEDLADWLGRAQQAAYEADGKMNCSFTTTISLKKKMVADEPVITLEVNSRERIPRPVIKRDLKFNSDGQLEFL